MGFTFAGRPCLDPAALLRECLDRGLPSSAWEGKANVYRVQNGREPGRGHLLLTRADLDAIDQTKAHDLEVFDGSHPKITLKKITLLSAVCVLPGADADPDAAYLCEVADRRHFLARIPVDRAFNLKKADGTGHLSATTNSGTAWTWQGVASTLVTALGLPTLTIPFTPHGTPENLAFYGGWAWAALNDVLDRLAVGLDYDPTADTFSLVRLGGASLSEVEDVPELKRLLPDRVWDGRPYDPARAWRPEKVRVRFPRRPLPTGGTSPFYAKDVTLGAKAGVEAGTYVQLDDDLTAVGATGTPSNASTLDARAQERADDWLRKRLKYDRPAQIVVAGHPAAAGKEIVGKWYGRAAWEDRGAGMKAEVGAAPDGALERWRAPVPPAAAGAGGDSGGGDTDTYQKILVGKVIRVGTATPDNDWTGTTGLGGTYGPYQVQPVIMVGGKYVDNPHRAYVSNVWSPVPMRVGTSDCPSYCELWEPDVPPEVNELPADEVDGATWEAHPIELLCVERDSGGAITNIGLPCADVPTCFDTTPPPVDGETPATPENPCPGIGVDPEDTCLEFTNLKVVVTGGWGIGGITTPAVYGPVSGSVQPLAGGGAILSLGNISTQLPWPSAAAPSELGNVVGNVYCDPDSGRWTLQVAPLADSSEVTAASVGTQEDGFPMVWGAFSGAIASTLDPGAVEGTISWDRAVLRRTGGCLAGELTTTGVPGLPGAGVLGPAVTGYAAGDIVTAGAAATAAGTYAAGVVTVDFGDAVVGVLTLTPDGAGSFTAAASGTGTVTVTEVIATPFAVLVAVSGGTTGTIAVTR